MPRSSLIVAYDENRLIGANGKLPWHLTDDLKNFKKITLNKTVIMGRKTYESIGSKPLTNRTNWVLSKTLNDNNVTCFKTWEDVLQAATKLDHDWCIIGGSSLYQKALSIVDDLHITQVKAKLQGDAYFPDIDLSKWLCKKKLKFNKNNFNDYDFCCYSYSRITYDK